MGRIPRAAKGRYSRRDVAIGGPHQAKYVRSWEISHKTVGGTRLSRDRGIERAQQGARNRGGAVAAAEFARREARGKGAVDGVLDRARGLRGPGMAVTVGEPVEHQRGGENHGGWI